MKVSQTGEFFAIRNPYELGEFVHCRVLENRGDRLLVELEDGSQGEILATEFAPRYMVVVEEAKK